jgi:hypothetical protein
MNRGKSLGSSRFAGETAAIAAIHSFYVELEFMK